VLSKVAIAVITAASTTPPPPMIATSTCVRWSREGWEERDLAADFDFVRITTPFRFPE
jgi:hypothetical protein